MNPLMLSAGIALTRCGSTVPPTCFPPTVLLPDASLPSPGSPRVEFPGFCGTTKALRLPAAPLAALRFPSFGDTRGARMFRSRHRCVPRRRAWGWSLGIPLREFFLGDGRISHVPGEPRLCLCPALRPRRIGIVRPLRRADAAPILTTRKATAMNFRGSITRLWHWLSTLCRMGHPTATQDSLPAAGPALPDGLGYPQGSDERFSMCVTSHSPFPSFHGARSVRDF